jgi:hypothetical protein
LTSAFSPNVLSVQLAHAQKAPAERFQRDVGLVLKHRLNEVAVRLERGRAMTARADRPTISRVLKALQPYDRCSLADPEPPCRRATAHPPFSATSITRSRNSCE